MAHAERCPICGGTGKVGKDSYGYTVSQIETCHGCGGLGWVTIHDDQPVWFPKDDEKAKP